MKQLVEFRDLCPPGKADTILRTCVARWDEFTYHAKLFYAAWSIPARPTVGFLTKWIDAATDFASKNASEEQNSCALKHETKTMQINVAPVQAAAPKVDHAAQFYADHKKATKQEVQAILDEDC
ncbi:hypothetical protein AXW67_09455 [Bradyrhizobium neotropicale]|uniref:Uncharacterized protein n=2 Tax=Bradyrhizobium neotropicale TaxID=1497615 RepID=A0A176Z9T1_9BRAD|nr:hypothetical protein AXW67_09455 [Bradyrhizobium neotropicale]